MEATDTTDAAKTVLPPLQDDEYEEIAWAIEKKGDPIKPMKIARGKVTDYMIKIDLLYCGVCHSDVHWGRDDQLPTVFPFVGGHELIGKAVEVGAKVTKAKVGDSVGVGCLVDSCGNCEYCADQKEIYCDLHPTMTYNGTREHGKVPGNKSLMTYGGYSGSHVCHEDFIINIPEGMDLAKAPPLLCAGITMYDPLEYWGFTKKTGQCVGVVGIGGLGTMGLKIAKALGHTVVAISSSNKKEAISKEKGADLYVNMSDPDSIKACEGKCNIILNTVSAEHDLNIYLPLLKKFGTLVQLGAVYGPHPVSQLHLMGTHQNITSSMIGGQKTHQDVVDFCFKENIYPEIEMIEAKDLNAVWEKLIKGDNDGLRYILDIKKSLENKDFI